MKQPPDEGHGMPLDTRKDESCVAIALLVPDARVRECNACGKSTKRRVDLCKKQRELAFRDHFRGSASRVMSRIEFF
jgi:hypothetical protein